MAIKLSEVQLDCIALNAFLTRMIPILAGVDSSAFTVFATPEGKQIFFDQLEKARCYGLASELELGRYIITAWMLGVDFDSRFPAMQEILVHPKLSSSQKSDAIEQTATMALETLNRKGEL